jgi:hypothetical protein
MICHGFAQTDPRVVALSSPAPLIETNPEVVVRHIQSYLNDKKVIIGVFQVLDLEGWKSFFTTVEDLRTISGSIDSKNSCLFRSLVSIHGEVPEFLAVQRLHIKSEQGPSLSFAPPEKSIWLLILAPVNSISFSKGTFTTYKAASGFDDIFLVRWPKEKPFKPGSLKHISETDIETIIRRMKDVSKTESELKGFIETLNHVQ